MLTRIAFASFALAAVAAAQSSLAINPNTAAGALQYLWVPGPTTNPVAFFMDMTVTNPITIQGASFPSYTPVGQQITVEFYTANAPFTTYVGNEVTAANWTLRASGSSVIPSAPAAANVCWGSGVQLAPGTYGVAVVVRNANNLFSNLGPQTISNADLSVTVGAVSAQAFTTAPSAYGTQTFHFNGTLFYAPGLVTGSCATKTSVGRGCNNVSGSFYQKWGTNAAMSAALTNRSLSLINTGAGYVLAQGATLAQNLTRVGVAPDEKAEYLATVAEARRLAKRLGGSPGGSGLRGCGGACCRLLCSSSGRKAGAPSELS